MIRANSLERVYTVSFFGTSFDLQVTAVLQRRNKELMLHSGEGRWAPGDRREVPHEILKETGDGARACLPFLLSSSNQATMCVLRRGTRRPASGGERVPAGVCVCPSKLACAACADNCYLIYLRAGPSVYVNVGLCVAQGESPHLDYTPLKEQRRLATSEPKTRLYSNTEKKQ